MNFKYLFDLFDLLYIKNLLFDNKIKIQIYLYFFIKIICNKKENF